ncbi:glycosyltransferase involved in cell wall biosynthesis [Catalinimonas alkaloidigena]|uniref:glycosyltransferase family 2 protein n=1 Tax=Catalinimonas alkaloidigena TaxID=1075417 RepID=UPI002404ED93|nr:glycosyltransferase family 2 protein [Catalinimonas alkaloidigena]MDF9800075.1 glycosyltransferase involved in cell wall biosynthesis [Catalinimonas alkaloidigena]
MNKDIKVIIPAFNEQNSIGKVIGDIPKDWVSEIIVVNNNSKDSTEDVARETGVTVLKEERQGYGYACLRGIAYTKAQDSQPDIIVFMDADYADYPEQLPEVVKPILEEGMDLVIGSRALGKKEKGAMTPQQVFGNWLATRLLRLLYGANFTDLGPFRAVTWEALQRIDMQDQTYGWTVEMQLKAAKLGLRSTEVPVKYRKRREGVSKVSGTLKGTLGAGYKIIWTIFKYR